MRQANRPGAWPQKTLANITLPAGAPVGGEDGAPLLWMAHAAGIHPQMWHALIAQFPNTGLWPVALQSLDNDGQRPWRSGELGYDALALPPDTRDVTAIIKGWWNDLMYDGEVPEGLAPFGREFPGLARAGGDHVEPFEPVAQSGSFLGLVPVTRPADVPWVLRWSGPVNHYADMGALSAVLRSWEERFDAYVTGIGFDTLTLEVGRPATEENALALAAEHTAICSDNVFQGSGSLEEYAAELTDSPVWQFWWD